MAASRKPPSVEAAVAAALRGVALRGRRVAVGLSGGVDSVVLLDALGRLAPRRGFELRAIHVNHGLSPNAANWQRFCAALCGARRIPFRAAAVKVSSRGRGLEAAAREARYRVLRGARVDAVALAHQLDDQAETVLLNLLRGAGLEGASGMPAVGSLGGKMLLRPLLGVPRSAIRAYATARRLRWVEDESNANEARTRNFLRHRVGPLLEARFPRWKESLARAARHFAARELDAERLLRAYLKGKGLRAPSEARLAEMLKQLGSGGPRTAIAHEGAILRTYRNRIFLTRSRGAAAAFVPRAWNGEVKLALPELGGELRFRRARGGGIDRRLVEQGGFEIRLRSGGERLRLDAKRPRRTLKNLFQEAGVPPWERARLPLLYCRDRLVWVPGLGVDVAFLPPRTSPGLVAEWRRYE